MHFSRSFQGAIASKPNGWLSESSDLVQLCHSRDLPVALAPASTSSAPRKPLPAPDALGTRGQEYRIGANSMRIQHIFTRAMAISAVFALTACGDSGFGLGSLNSGNIFGGDSKAAEDNFDRTSRANKGNRLNRAELDGDEFVFDDSRETIWDLFRNSDNPNTTLEVNRFIWVASLEVLDFLPVQAADPFSGVIVTGFGRPPGGRTAYRATVHVTDPALDARSLNLALERQGGGAVDADTVHAVEDAILTRARQLRITHGDL